MPWSEEGKKRAAAPHDSNPPDSARTRNETRRPAAPLPR
jgi:hypothetical protein